MPQEIIARAATVKPASRKNCTLISFFWHAGPPQCVVRVAPPSSGSTLGAHWHAQHSGPSSSAEAFSVYFLLQEPWPVQFAVFSMHAFADAQQKGIVVLGVDGDCAGLSSCRDGFVFFEECMVGMGASLGLTRGSVTARFPFVVRGLLPFGILQSGRRATMTVLSWFVNNAISLSNSFSLVAI